MMTNNDFAVTRLVRARTIVTLATAVMLAVPIAAWAQALADVKGGKDHPLLSRYAGSVLLGYKHQEFDEFVIPLASVQWAEGKPTATKVQRVEGQTTRLLYLAPEGRSTLEILRNYEQELIRAGFQVLYRCAADQCGALGGGALAGHLYTSRARLSYGNSSTADYANNAFASIVRDPRYVVMKRANPQGEVYVSLFVGVNDFSGIPATHLRSMALLDLVVKGKMETGMVTVDAAAMASEINQSGHVAVYGILFDTDQAVLKADSEPTLAEIAKLLKQDTRLNLYVVGHTDNVGALEYNLGLSDRRAAAVVDTLKTKFGIAANRLRAMGVGPVAPVVSNGTEQGRAKNRRVELVRQ